jgi:hypothetical protein
MTTDELDALEKRLSVMSYPEARDASNALACLRRQLAEAQRLEQNSFKAAMEAQNQLTAERERADMLEAANNDLGVVFSERDAALAEARELREAFKDVLAHLVAAHSLLERGGKKAAPSDKMFDQMLKDYAASIERGRSLLARIDAELTEGA